MLKRIIATALGLLLLSAGAAEAQYFGRNKVQYQRFRFTILETPHFDVYYYPEERDAAEVAARLAERWYTRLSQTLDHTFADRQRIILYASHAHFAQTSIIDGDVPEGVGGFTDHLAGRVVLPFAAGLGETDHVLGHEIVHAFQRDILRRQGRSLSMLPLWFSEGMAEQLSVGALDANTRMWLRDAERSHRVPTLAQLDNPKYFPYRYGQALWSWLGSRYGSEVAARALRARSGSAIGRLQQATGARKEELEAGWREFVAEVAGHASSAEPATTLRRLIGGGPDDGQLNVGPALSPDGRFLVFLSERDQHAVDVYLADAKSGRVRRRLLSTATDPHFDALQFIESAGAWDLQSRSFVLATVGDGHPVLTVFDMPSGRVRQRISVPGVDQIFSPSWSPTGVRIVFSGMRGGVTDIYALTLSDGHVQPLTHDLYSDLQPSWSPDGSEIVFASDRFSSSADRLEFGRYGLGVIEWPSLQVRYLGGTAAGKNIDPHWCPDDGCVYFVSDETGTSNVYRMEMPSGAVTQMTEDPIGVSGVTALSPAISIGEAGTRVAMSVYRAGAYQIRTLDLPLSQQADAVAVPAAPPGRALAPRPAAASASAVGGPERPASFRAKPYLPSLSLLSFGQPYLSAGGGAFGSFVRAGMSLSVADLFGEQELSSALQVGRHATDFAVQTSYVNRRSRWNWGISGSQIPWLVGAGIDTHTGTSSSGDALIQRDSTFEQQDHRQVAGVLMYPFNRARRVEFSTGLDAVTFSRQVTRTSFSAETLRRVDQTTSTTATGRPAMSALGGAAMVYDTAVFGVASPVMGERYRVGLTASAGDLTFATASADYRRYWPVTDNVSMAVRLEEVARLGADISDPRLLPLVWTAREIVRGYDTDAVIERASRVSVANLELRTPLGTLLRRRRMTLPVEVFAFSDWGRFAAPASARLTTDVQRLWSAGFGARLDVAGFIFEFNGVHPLADAGGWRLAVNFRPGF